MKRKRSISVLYHFFVALIEAIQRRNEKILIPAISMANGSGYKKRLISLIKKAEETLEDLRCLGGFQHPIPDLNKPIIAELMNYVSPPLIVRDIMTATFLLLGETEEELKVHICCYPMPLEFMFICFKQMTGVLLSFHCIKI